jgi:hypothetical protein
MYKLALFVISSMFTQEGMGGFHFPSTYRLLCCPFWHMPYQLQENHMEFPYYPKVFVYSNAE